MQFISVNKSTMIITIAITILLLGVAVAEDSCDYGDVVQGDCPIENCCDLGYGRSPFALIFNKPKVYDIKNFCGNRRSILKGYCDTITDGGGWIVIQRRQDGSVDFNKNWVDYEDGFGSLTGEFWYGLRAIHCLTSRGQWELRIDYTSANEIKGYLSYNNFRVGPDTEQYPLTISGFEGVTTDPFSYNNRMKFTTRDRDNDQRSSDNCAVNGGTGIGGGWWYRACSYIYPNHLYNHINTIHFNGIWHDLVFIEIKIRPKNCII